MRERSWVAGVSRNPIRSSWRTWPSFADSTYVPPSTRMTMWTSRFFATWIWQSFYHGKSGREACTARHKLFYRRPYVPRFFFGVRRFASVTAANVSDCCEGFVLISFINLVPEFQKGFLQGFYSQTGSCKSENNKNGISGVLKTLSRVKVRNYWWRYFGAL